jgi:small subunit ribosomal protein S10
MAEKIEIKLKSFDYRMLDKSAAEIVNTAKHSGSRVCGPVPMPTQIERFTVNRSPHVDKKSMDQFELRTHGRLILIKEATPQTVDDLKRLNLPAGVEIAVHL